MILISRLCPTQMQSNLLQPFPLKNAGRLPCFYAAQKPRFCLHQKGENRDLPLWNPPSRYVQQESLDVYQSFPLKNAGIASLFLCCAKATLLLAPKGGEPRSPPLESPIAICSAGIADEVLLKRLSLKFQNH